MNVLLPQPDGPMIAVTRFCSTWNETSRRTGPAVVAHREVADVEDGLVAHPGNVIRISRPSRLVAST